MREFCKNWRFTKDVVEGAHLNEYDDSSWEIVSIPHDWSIEGEFDGEKGEGCTGFLLGGLGWYRKSFITTRDMAEGITEICFDGVYNNCDVYINGKYLGFHPYGYSAFHYDLSQYLNEVNEENIIAVRVDHTRYADSRWYTGSGIYRKVDLLTRSKVSIPIWGVKITTPIANEKYGLININVNVENNLLIDKDIVINYEILDESDNKVISSSKKVKITSNKEIDLEEELIIDNPVLWEVAKGYLYKLRISILDNGKEIQVKENKFGIRSFEFDIDKGFFINGKHEYIKGVCLHHDAGLVGAAVPKDVWKKRLEVLRGCGCNAIRTSHNPASTEFLDVCDEMGFLVQEEFYDEWDNPKDKRDNCAEKKENIDYITRGYAEHFQEWAETDLKVTVLRDINHPCIIQWSIGNEIEWTYPKYNTATGYFTADATGNYFWTLPPYSIEKVRENVSKLPEDHYEVGRTAAKLSKWVKELDTTRPVIANCILPNASYESGYTKALDIVGYSYRQIAYDYGHENYNDKPIMGTENFAQYHEWKAIIERPFISGMYIWTGFDYLGESGKGHNKPFPIKGSGSGMVDYANFPKPSYYMMKSLWDDEINMKIYTQSLDKSIYVKNNEGFLEEKEEGAWKHRLWTWHDVNEHWNYKNGQDVVVEIYSNCSSIELFINDKSLGVKCLSEFEDHVYKWCVPYEKGELKAIGKKDEDTLLDFKYTTYDISNVSLSVDKSTIKEDEVVSCILQLVDKNGHDITCENSEVELIVNGDIRVLGIDNGANDSVQPYKTTKCVTSNGRCLVMLQGDKKGNVTIQTKLGDILGDIKTITVI